jgi:hypothetical protein
MRTMSNDNIHVAVQALWLQYKGLTAVVSHSWNGLDNAAYRQAVPSRTEDLPVPGAFMVAT